MRFRRCCARCAGDEQVLCSRSRDEQRFKSLGFAAERLADHGN